MSVTRNVVVAVVSLVAVFYVCAAKIEVSAFCGPKRRANARAKRLSTTRVGTLDDDRSRLISLSLSSLSLAVCQFSGTNPTISLPLFDGIFAPPDAM